MTSEKQLCLIWSNCRVPILANQESGQCPSGANAEPSTSGRWRPSNSVEQQCTNAIRGTEIVDMAAFETGVHYMEWTEAVYRRAATGQAVYLPL